MIIKLGNVAPAGPPVGPGGTVQTFGAPDEWMWDRVLDALAEAWPNFSAGAGGEVVPPIWAWTDDDEFTPHVAARFDCPALTAAQVEQVEELVRVVEGRVCGLPPDSED